MFGVVMLKHCIYIAPLDKRLILEVMNSCEILKKEPEVCSYSVWHMVYSDPGGLREFITSNVIVHYVVRGGEVRPQESPCPRSRTMSSICAAL